MKYHIAYLLLFTLAFLEVNAQKQANIWYFGNKAGINFNTTPPSVLTDGQMDALEGTSTISDSVGNLLFYTNGIAVWNKFHQIMSNGTGLKGDISSTQAALIIKQPQNDSIYYIFTTDAVAGADGLQYHVVNIYAKNDSGEIILKNQPLISPVCEKLAATVHQNQKDIWIVVHGFNNNLFYCYLLSSEGLIDCPIISATGQIHGPLGINAQGGMQFSIGGTLMAVSGWGSLMKRTQLFDFDKQFGVFKYKYNLDVPTSYGITYSPNKRYLYLTDYRTSLKQFDLHLNDTNQINATSVILYQDSSFKDGLHDIQLAADGKIYISFLDSTYLGVINYPDSFGAACNFVERQFDLLGRKAQYGLPQFLQSYLYQPSIEFSYDLNAQTNTGSFSGKDTNASITGWYWSFEKDIISSRVGQNVSYTFSDTGAYKVTLIVTHPLGADTISKDILIYPKVTPPNLGKDTTICELDSLVLTTPDRYWCYRWQDASSSNSYTVKEAGTYYVVLTDYYGNQWTDTIEVNTQSNPPKPVITQQGDSLISSAADSFQWYLNSGPISGKTGFSLKPAVNGIYSVKIKQNGNPCESFSDPYSVNFVGNAEIALNKWQIYPNPAGEMLFIDFPENAEMQIYDVLGKSIITSQVLSPGQQEINLSSIPPGLYIVRIKSTNGNQINTSIIKRY